MSVEEPRGKRVTGGFGVRFNGNRCENVEVWGRRMKRTGNPKSAM